MSQILIIGAGDHGISVTESILASGHTLIGYWDESRAGGHLLGRRVVGLIPPGHLESGGQLVMAIGDNSGRERTRLTMFKQVPDSSFPAIVHPSASVSRFATIGAGTVVLQGAIVGSGASVGSFCIINTASSLDHGGDLADFSSLAPGVVTGGNVRVGTRTAVGIGCIIKHGLSIGNDTVIGGGSYVHCDIPDHVVAFGTPAKVTRKRDGSDTYL